MDELYKLTLRGLEFQDEIERSGAERLEGYRAEIANILKNLKSNTTTRTPVREKKKPKHVSNNESTSSTNSSEPATSSGRPIRSAAEKAKLELKEPALGTKMRQEVTVKVERVSSMVPNNTKTSKENNPNSINVKMEKLSIAAQNKKSKERSSDPKMGDESVIVVPGNANVVVQLSDDEEGDNEVFMMPPPPKPAPRKINSKKINSEISRSASSDVPVKSEQFESLASQRPIRSTRGKRQVPQPIVEPKNEKLSDVAITTGKTDVTLESVYEDAITDDGQSAGSSKPSYMEMDCAMSLPGESADCTYIQPPRPNEATFVASNHPNDQTMTIQSSMAGDATFISQVPAFNSGDTFCMPTAVQTRNDETVVIEKTSKTSKQTSISSIMTEDYSDDEIPLQLLSKKQNNELFNPCVQSPMKKKVEAFEKVGLLAQIPTQQRQTRTKTRANAAASVDDSGSVSSTISAAKAKFNTPNVADQRNNAKGSQITPQSLCAATSNQFSRLAHLNRAASASKLPQHSRESSAEDVKRGLMASTEDKKRKREEKLKQVQQQREAREKEKLDKFKKQMQEKEDKLQQEAEKKRLAKEKKNREAETRKNLEEINRNLKQQQQNQKEDAMRAEREQIDMIRIAAEKKALQQRLKQNIDVSVKKKPITLKYTFEMLNTDDETDDESNPRPGRPTPPAWSLRGNREERIASQSYLSLDCIENLFPVVAMTPNLKELFPDINEKYLRRNSSAVWNTPPRYSMMELPKYDV